MNLWNLPGGGVEKNESPWDAVVREVKEECGVDISIIRLSGIYFRANKDEYAFAFECRIEKGTPGLSDEASAVKFFSLENIPANTSPNQKLRIEDAFHSSELVMKTQPGPSSRELIAQGKL